MTMPTTAPNASALYQDWQRLRAEHSGLRARDAAARLGVSEAELTAIPGVGPKTASAIIAYREQNGPFRSIDQLAEVKGIGPAKLAAMRDAVTI